MHRSTSREINHMDVARREDIMRRQSSRLSVSPETREKQPGTQKCWLVVADGYTWSRLRRSSEWWLPIRALSRAKKIQAGDRAVVYVKGRAVLVAEFRFQSRVKRRRPSSRAVDSDDLLERFPLRVSIRYRTPLPRGMKFEPIVQNLRFIGRKQHWGPYLRGVALRPLSARDFAVLSNGLRKRKSGP